MADAGDRRAVPGPADPADSWLTWANDWPSLRALGIECLRLDQRAAEFTIAAVSFPANPNGSVNGGILAAAADQAMGVLVMRGCPPGLTPATVSLHMQYHQPALAPLRMRAELLPGGRRVQFVEVVIEDRAGVRCATGHGTMASSRAAAAGQSGPAT
jgi:uncharacterized protein (TIGR00369 family)